MKLHHFTCNDFLPAIFANGLIFGDTPISEYEGVNAVNLTTDHRPNKQKWGQASILNKSAIRLTVEIASDDPALQKWTDFAKTRVNPAFYGSLDRAGDGKSESWWLYHGTIPWHRVEKVYDTVNYKYESLELITFSPDQIQTAQALSDRAQQQTKDYLKALREGKPFKGELKA